MRKIIIRRVTASGRAIRKTYKTELERIEGVKARGLRYRQTARGKATSRASSLKYLQTERGKELHRAYQRERYRKSKGYNVKIYRKRVGRDERRERLLILPTK